MRQTDIAIVGGGLAGSTAAAMLGRAGIDTVLIDPHERYPQDLRCEKLDARQVAILERTGLAPAVLRAATHDREVWVARFGRLVEKRRSDQRGILYDDLVNTIRAEIPAHVGFSKAKATTISAGDDRQHVVLSDGEEISARLIVMAHGLNLGVGHGLGLSRHELSPCHSITLGFDVAPVGRPQFEFPALTYWPERASDRLAYLSLFPIGATMRANVMVYRDMRDPWLREMRSAPVEALLAVMPGLSAMLGDFAVPGFVKIRPADLYVTRGINRAGVVLVGDAYATSCPAAGTGTGKVFTDVERLCNVHIPAWLASPGMSRDKIAAFYADPVKRASDEDSLDKAYWLRSYSTDSGLSWRALRWARVAAGMVRQAGRNLAPASPIAGTGELRPT
jgi:2-polyprenyl-6-methoxyphenol hydroxylase-like FAD-dependent oxidoreductase